MSETIKRIIFVVVICGFALVFFLLTKDSSTEQTNDINPSLPVGLEKNETLSLNEEVKSELAIVDVKGEVNKPGVYELTLDSRVDDVIQLAGGFTEEADETQINLAQKVHDEMIIIVFKHGDTDLPSENSAANPSVTKVRINYATQEEIEVLSGVGPSKAQAIIQYREENGLFQAPEDLLQVSGIGEKTLENFVEQIQVP